MKKLFFLLGITYWLLLLSCSSPTEEKNQFSKITDTTKKNLGLHEQIAKMAPLPTLYKQAHFHWGKYKQQNKQMLNCGDKKPGGLWKDSVPGFFYNYCDFNWEQMNKPRKPGEPLQKYNAEFAVFTKGKKIPMYGDSLRETLVFMKCCKADKRLEGFDLVGKRFEEVKNIFGVEDSTVLNRVPNRTFYFRENELLCIKCNKKQEVTFFYWLKLEKIYSSANEIPAELLLLE